jgi:hypothetical protein
MTVRSQPTNDERRHRGFLPSAQQTRGGYHHLGRLSKIRCLSGGNVPDGPCAELHCVLAFVVTLEGRRKLDSEKQVYVAPQLRAIYSAPRLIEHGSVAKLTLASMLPPGFHNGNQNQAPPPISSTAVPGNDVRPAIDPVTGRPVVDGGGIQNGGGGQQQARDVQPQSGGGGQQQQEARDVQPQKGGGDQQQEAGDVQPQNGGGGQQQQQEARDVQPQNGGGGQQQQQQQQEARDAQPQKGGGDQQQQEARDAQPQKGGGDQQQEGGSGDKAKGL